MDLHGCNDALMPSSMYIKKCILFPGVIGCVLKASMDKVASTSVSAGMVPGTIFSKFIFDSIIQWIALSPGGSTGPG